MLAVKNSKRLLTQKRPFLSQFTHFSYLLFYEIPCNINANSASFQLYAKLKKGASISSFDQKSEKTMCTV